MKIIFLLFNAAILFISCNRSCDEKGGHDTYIIENKSDKKITYKIMNYFEGDTIPFDNNPLIDTDELILPSSVNYNKVKLYKEECIEDDYKDGQKYWFYVFDYDSIKVIPWDTIRVTGRGVLGRKRLDLEYLQNSNFTIIYP